MARFREQFDADYFRLGDAIIDALLASYREWGGTASPPTVLIVDFRGVPTWSEFEILQNRFEAAGCRPSWPTRVTSCTRTAG